MLTDAGSPRYVVGTEFTRTLKIFENVQEDWEGKTEEESGTII